jgi:hypothetical protein
VRSAALEFLLGYGEDAAGGAVLDEGDDAEADVFAPGDLGGGLLVGEGEVEGCAFAVEAVYLQTRVEFVAGGFRGEGERVLVVLDCFLDGGFGIGAAAADEFGLTVYYDL